MSIQLEFINFIVPIKTIEEKYPGGWQQCLEDYKNLVGGRVWYDDYLFRDGAMNPRDIEYLVNEWKEMGFAPTVTIDGEVHWKDVCVVEGMFGGSTMPCDWLTCDAEDMSASMNGDESEAVVSRANFEHDPGY